MDKKRINMFMYNVDLFFPAGRTLRKSSFAVFSLLTIEFGFLLPTQGRQTHQAGSQVESGTANESAEGKSSDRPSIAADLEVPTPSAAAGAKEQRKSGSKKQRKSGKKKRKKQRAYYDEYTEETDNDYYEFERAKMIQMSESMREKIAEQEKSLQGGGPREQMQDQNEAPQHAQVKQETSNANADVKSGIMQPRPKKRSRTAQAKPSSGNDAVGLSTTTAKGGSQLDGRQPQPHQEEVSTILGVDGARGHDVHDVRNRLDVFLSTVTSLPQKWASLKTGEEYINRGIPEDEMLRTRALVFPSVARAFNKVYGDGFVWAEALTDADKPASWQALAIRETKKNVEDKIGGAEHVGDFVRLYVRARDVIEYFIEKWLPEYRQVAEAAEAAARLKTPTSTAEETKAEEAVQAAEQKSQEYGDFSQFRLSRDREMMANIGNTWEQTSMRMTSRNYNGVVGTADIPDMDALRWLVLEGPAENFARQNEKNPIKRGDINPVMRVLSQDMDAKQHILANGDEWLNNYLKTKPPAIHLAQDGLATTVTNKHKDNGAGSETESDHVHVVELKELQDLKMLYGRHETQDQAKKLARVLLLRASKANAQLKQQVHEDRAQEQADTRKAATSLRDEDGSDSDSSAQRSDQSSQPPITLSQVLIVEQNPSAISHEQENGSDRVDSLFHSKHANSKHGAPEQDVAARCLCYRTRSGSLQIASYSRDEMTAQGISIDWSSPTHPTLKKNHKGLGGAVRPDMTRGVEWAIDGECPTLKHRSCTEQAEPATKPRVVQIFEPPGCFGARDARSTQTQVTALHQENVEEFQKISGPAHEVEGKKDVCRQEKTLGRLASMEWRYIADLLPPLKINTGTTNEAKGDRDVLFDLIAKKNPQELGNAAGGGTGYYNLFSVKRAGEAFGFRIATISSDTEVDGLHKVVAINHSPLSPTWRMVHNKLGSATWFRVDKTSGVEFYTATQQHPR
ncbi:unnamed protein product [Amoebophrya sp. A120]|nr:unnamed protein product [Amoebophrya sp. A120]|eukprot:GSA120T00007595001.1